MCMGFTQHTAKLSTLSGVHGSRFMVAPSSVGECRRFCHIGPHEFTEGHVPISVAVVFETFHSAFDTFPRLSPSSFGGTKQLGYRSSVQTIGMLLRMCFFVGLCHQGGWPRHGARSKHCLVWRSGPSTRSCIEWIGARVGVGGLVGFRAGGLAAGAADAQGGRTALLADGRAFVMSSANDTA